MNFHNGSYVHKKLRSKDKNTFKRNKRYLSFLSRGSNMYYKKKKN